MGGIIQGARQSELRWDAQRLVICLPRQVFGAMWDALVERLAEVWRSRTFIAWTQPTMTARGNGPDAPRWKSYPLDVLSGLLFLLKVSASHELVRLWAVIDWAAINALCAPLYHNAHGGQHAWAPAQMMALLVLMFPWTVVLDRLYGVPHETTLLRCIQENIVWCWFPGHPCRVQAGQAAASACLAHGRITARCTPSASALGASCSLARTGEQVLTLAVQACIEAGLVANELVRSAAHTKRCTST